MRYDWLLEPISEAEPCGPDLDEAGDENYLNYVLSVSGRIPEQYYDAREDKPFDRAAIKIKDEVEAIGGFLKETRDIRLLCIEARFHSFMGDLPSFADCLDAMAGLTERFWADVHPKALDGDFTMRQSVLEGLDDWKQVIQPLHHAFLVRDKRLGPIMFRHFAIAKGVTPPREDEVVPSEGDAGQALAAEDNRALSDANFDAATRATKALVKLRETFIENSGYDYAPSFKRLPAFFEELIEVFQAARPDLAGAAGPAEESTADGSEEAAGDTTAVARATGRVADHATAAAALLAAEGYFAAYEPSTPVLVLVHQARLLVGKPLTYALEALLPEDAPRAMIRIHGDLNVQLNMAQLKQLTDDMPELSNGANGAVAEANGFSASARSEAMTLMAEVEQFYKTAEPSSPVPTLLAKARGFTNRDFNSIVSDMLGPPPS